MPDLNKKNYLRVPFELHDYVVSKVVDSIDGIDVVDFYILDFVFRNDRDRLPSVEDVNGQYSYQKSFDEESVDGSIHRLSEQGHLLEYNSGFNEGYYLGESALRNYNTIMCKVYGGKCFNNLYSIAWIEDRKYLVLQSKNLCGLCEYGHALNGVGCGLIVQEVKEVDCWTHSMLYQMGKGIAVSLKFIESPSDEYKQFARQYSRISYLNRWNKTRHALKMYNKPVSEQDCFVMPKYPFR